MEAIVSGAGIAGLAFAGRLARASGWHVTVVERAHRLREHGYMIDFFGPGFVAAEQAGLLPALRALAYDIGGVDLVGPMGATRARIDYRGLRLAANGRLISLMRPDIERVLFDAMPDGVTVRFGRRVVATAQTAADVEVELDDGSRITGDALIGADGIHSTTRRLVFGDEEQFIRPLGFHTCAYVIDDERIHTALAGRFVMTDTMDRVMGLYGLGRGRVAMFGAHRNPSIDLPRDPRATIRAAYAGLGWITQDVLDACPDADEIYYDLVAQVEVPAWSDRRVTLIGDASQAVSLLAGQGASIAVAGGFLLADALADAQSGDIPDLIARYETAWRPVVAAKQSDGRRVAGSFIPGSRRALMVRRWMLRTMPLPGIGRLISRSILGKEAALPRV